MSEIISNINGMKYNIRDIPIDVRKAAHLKWEDHPFRKLNLREKILFILFWGILAIGIGYLFSFLIKWMFK